MIKQQRSIQGNCGAMCTSNAQSSLGTHSEWKGRQKIWHLAFIEQATVCISAITALNFVPAHATLQLALDDETTR